MNSVLLEVYNQIRQKFEEKPIWLINQLKKTIHPRVFILIYFYINIINK